MFFMYTTAAGGLPFTFALGARHDLCIFSHGRRVVKDYDENYRDEQRALKVAR
jgi:hypothetical protein